MLYDDLAVGLKVIYVHTGRAMTVIARDDAAQMVTCRFYDQDHKETDVQMPPMFLQPLPMDPVAPPRDVEEWHDTERTRQSDEEKNNS